MNAWLWEVPAAAAIAVVPIAMSEAKNRLNINFDRLEGHVFAIAILGYAGYATWATYGWWGPVFEIAIFAAAGLLVILGFVGHGAFRALRHIRREVKTEYGHGVIKQWRIVRRKRREARL